jgi:hypothetical protein
MTIVFLELALMIGLFIPLTAENNKPVDIGKVAAAGTVTETRYANSFFKLTVDAPGAALHLNPLVNATGQRAQLLQALCKATKWEDNYNFAVLADSLNMYPRLQSPADYVRSVRHQLEKEGMQTVKEEYPVVVGGVQFTSAILQEQTPDGRKYYRGMYATFRNGYILSFDVEASSEARLNQLVVRMVKLDH